ncbi:MAG: hypothetical protein U1D30_22680 [Planctomycetota bacterium]
MRNLPKAGIFFLALGVFAVGAMFFLNTPTVEARPQYLKEFKDKYGDAFKKANCAVCHPSKDKKERNDYGKAVGTALGSKNAKDSKKIGEALDKAAEEKNADGVKFGDLLKEGKSPAGE